MRDALHAAGRPILFNLCEWGNNNPWLWGKDVGHAWRISGDIAKCFDCEVKRMGYSDYGVMKIVYIRKDIRKYSGPDHWNDFDMMQVGNVMTLNEDRSHFSMWSMLATSLIAGNDLRKMTTETKNILTNKEVIAVDQDSLGIQAFRHDAKDSIEIWAKPLLHGDWAICFLNRSMKPNKIDFDWAKCLMQDDFAKMELDPAKITYTIRNLWTTKNMGKTNGVLKSEIAGHDVLMIRLIK
jgi:alpha-galactosidase